MNKPPDLSAFDPISLLRPRRRIEGISAILLPFQANGDVDWAGFSAQVRRTAQAGLIPVVNMDTGYGNLIDDATKRRALELTRTELGGGRFVAGAFVRDQPGAKFNADAHARQMATIQEFGGTPVIFQSYGLTQQNDDGIVAAYETLAKHAAHFIGFELGTMFAPFAVFLCVGRVASVRTGFTAGGDC